MFKAIKKLFDTAAASQHAPREADHLRMAIASLLHESRRVDLEHDTREHSAALDALKALFGLEAAEAEALLVDARERAPQLISYYPLVAAIKRDFSLEQRVHLVELLWRIVYADGALHPEEDHFVRKIAHLLYVPNTQAMLARSRARPAGHGDSFAGVPKT